MYLVFLLICCLNDFESFGVDGVYVIDDMIKIFGFRKVFGYCFCFKCLEVKEGLILIRL